MDFIDLKAQLQRIRHCIDRRIKTVLDHGIFIMGPEVFELESVLANYAKTPYCLSCANGTDALLIPLMAWGVGPGDAIFVPTFTFFATAEVVSLIGATPIFVDVDDQTFNICSHSLEAAFAVASKAGLRPRGIIPVNLFGQMADYDSLRIFAQRHNLFILEDAAQSFGATWDSKKSCSLGDISATSFFPAKPLGCYGDGGAIFCADQQLLEIMKSIRVHGQGKEKYENIRIGINGRLDTIQAAILLEKMLIFDEEIALRNTVAKRYTEFLSPTYSTPRLHPKSSSVWAQYSLRSPCREAITQYLNSKNIPTMIYYPTPLHLQAAFNHLNYKRGMLPQSEKLSLEIFSIPMHPYLSTPDQDYIIDALNSFKA